MPGAHLIIRPGFAAALAFMRLTARGDVPADELADWLRDRVVDPGLSPMPSVLYEPSVGTVPLDGARAAASMAPGPPLGARIAARARARVVASLAGLLRRPCDDRFLAAAIYGGRVQRVSVDRDSGWRPTLVGNERLSDIVLALFAADVLEHREDYDAELCVCEVCGHVSFDREADMRTRCVEHPL